MSNHAQHTPGPIEVWPSVNDGELAYRLDVHEGHNCNVIGFADREADAVLWAAAPDLLAACEQAESVFLAWIKHPHLCYADRAGCGDNANALRAAIRKARGEE